MHTFVLFSGTNPLPKRDAFRGCSSGNIVVYREYLSRQALTLLKFGKATSDPNVAAGLIEKAADLQSQLDQTAMPADLSPRAPDVQSEGAGCSRS
jgi:hypothetical protein